MKQYIIAGFGIQVSGQGLNPIPGFSLFETSDIPDSPVLTLQTKEKLPPEDLPPTHKWMFDGDFRYDFFNTGEYYLLRIKPVADTETYKRMEIRLRGDSCFAVTDMDDNTSGYLLRFAVWTAFGLAVLRRQAVAIHASTIAYNRKAILFLGESGTGKSTHTRLWLNHIPDAELLNDDSPFIRVNNDNTIQTYGSPWSGKTHCYKNTDMPLGAFVRLSQAPYNKIKKMSKIEAVGALLPSCSPSFTYDNELSEHIYAILSAVLKNTPVYALECLPDADAARLVFDTLKNDGII